MKTILMLATLLLAACGQKPAVQLPAVQPASVALDGVAIDEIFPLPNGDAYAVGSGFGEHGLTSGLWLIRNGEAIRVKEVDKLTTPPGPIAYGWTPAPRKPRVVEGEAGLPPGYTIDEAP